MIRIRGRKHWLVAIAAALVASMAMLLLKNVAEKSVRARIESSALRHGMVTRIGAVRVGVWPLLRLEKIAVELGHGAHLQADSIAVTWRGRWRLTVRDATLAGPAQVAVTAPITTWNVAGLLFGGELQVTLVEPQGGLSIRKRSESSATEWTVDLRALDISRLLDVKRSGQPLLEGGIANGSVALLAGSDRLRFQVDLSTRGARVGGLADSETHEAQLGNPTGVTLRFEGTWQKARGAVDVPDIDATVAGAIVAGSLALRDLDTDPAIDLDLGVKKLDFAQLLGTSGLEVPESLGLSPGSSADLGSAAIDLHVRGRLSEPASLSVSQKINFKPPRVMPPAIARLRGDFMFRADDGRGPPRSIHVSPESPDFIALGSVPPLFLRTLLLAEDAGFYGHRGIDLRELPGALLTNWSRGTAARGASTITQQLAKNLFLTRDKQLGRKLQELAITFLLESALGKERILEIYLNIIEWGPDLHGLRPAAWIYFGREPRALTSGEMAFLVAIIPGPIKYQSSFANGSPGPGLRSLIDDLLAKLRSVDAIGEEEYRRALNEPIRVVR